MVKVHVFRFESNWEYKKFNGNGYFGLEDLNNHVGFIELELETEEYLYKYLSKDTLNLLFDVCNNYRKEDIIESTLTVDCIADNAIFYVEDFNIYYLVKGIGFGCFKNKESVLDFLVNMQHDLYEKYRKKEEKELSDWYKELESLKNKEYTEEYAEKFNKSKKELFKVEIK